MKLIGTYKIPEYAICAIEYGDYSGISDEDEQEIKNFLIREFPTGYVVDWHTNEPEHEPYFSPVPEFGLPTNVVDADFYKP